MSWRKAMMPIVAAASVFAADGKAAEPRGNPLKAAILYNFVHFVEWPKTAFADRKAPIVIGIFGEDPFGSMLDGLVSRETVGDRKLVVVRTRDPEAATHCHIVFVSSCERDRTQDLFTKLKNKPVLTVAEYDGFVRSGGMIVMHEFVGERIQLRVHLAAIHAVGLALSGKLLRVAEVITPEQD
jgi:hypothetical protein